MKIFFCISYCKNWKKVNYDFKVGQIRRKTIFEGGSMWKKTGPGPRLFLAADAHGLFDLWARETTRSLNASISSFTLDSEEDSLCQFYQGYRHYVPRHFGVSLARITTPTRCRNNSIADIEPITNLSQVKSHIKNRNFNTGNLQLTLIQSVDSRHDQPFFLSRRSDLATLDLESPEWSGDSAFRVTRVIWRL